MTDRDIHPNAAPMSKGSRLPIMLMIILTYGIFGPPVGAFWFWFGLLPIGIINDLQSGKFDILRYIEFMRSMAGGFVFSIPFSYVFGFIQAFLTGAFLGGLYVAAGKVGYLAAIIAPVIIGFIVYAFMVFGEGSESVFWIWVACVGVLSSLTLRFLFRWLFAKS